MSCVAWDYSHSAETKRYQQKASLQSYKTQIEIRASLFWAILIGLKQNLSINYKSPNSSKVKTRVNVSWKFDLSTLKITLSTFLPSRFWAWADVLEKITHVCATGYPCMIYGLLVLAAFSPTTWLKEKEALGTRLGGGDDGEHVRFFSRRVSATIRGQEGKI